MAALRQSSNCTPAADVQRARCAEFQFFCPLRRSGSGRGGWPGRRSEPCAANEAKRGAVKRSAVREQRVSSSSRRAIRWRSRTRDGHRACDPRPRDGPPSTSPPAQPAKPSSREGSKPVRVEPQRGSMRSTRARPCEAGARPGLFIRRAQRDTATRTDASSPARPRRNDRWCFVKRRQRTPFVDDLWSGVMRSSRVASISVLSALPRLLNVQVAGSCSRHQRTPSAATSCSRIHRCAWFSCCRLCQ
jgi:hypothetical protein